MAEAQEKFGATREGFDGLRRREERGWSAFLFIRVGEGRHSENCSLSLKLVAAPEIYITDNFFPRPTHRNSEFRYIGKCRLCHFSLRNSSLGPSKCSTERSVCLSRNNRAKFSILQPLEKFVTSSPRETQRHGSYGFYSIVHHHRGAEAKQEELSELKQKCIRLVVLQVLLKISSFAATAMSHVWCARIELRKLKLSHSAALPPPSPTSPIRPRVCL